MRASGFKIDWPAWGRLPRRVQAALIAAEAHLRGAGPPLTLAQVEALVELTGWAFNGVEADHPQFETRLASWCEGVEARAYDHARRAREAGAEDAHRRGPASGSGPRLPSDSASEPEQSAERPRDRELDRREHLERLIAQVERREALAELLRTLAQPGPRVANNHERHPGDQDERDERPAC
jgi:hypothetical protein